MYSRYIPHVRNILNITIYTVYLLYRSVHILLCAYNNVCLEKTKRPVVSTSFDGKQNVWINHGLFAVRRVRLDTARSDLFLVHDRRHEIRMVIGLVWLEVLEPKYQWVVHRDICIQIIKCIDNRYMKNYRDHMRNYWNMKKNQFIYWLMIIIYIINRYINTIIINLNPE